ncbi:MAG: DNA-binding protein [Gammaproteobacteria bacterium]|nr:MAG: DNA-binding protein [Gammaproteobacteria bacterium]
MASNERTLDLLEAAHFLRLSPEVLRRKTKQGCIRAAKPGKCWVYLESDLVEYLRSLYPVPGQALSSSCAQTEVTLWHSTNAVQSGGSVSPVRMAGRYENLLKLPISSKRRNSTTS